MVSVLNFFFWTVWSSDSAGRRSVREHAEPLGVRHCVARAFRRLRSLPQANGSKENERRRRIGTPLRFPAPPRMGMAGHSPLSESSRSEAKGPLSPAPWGRAGWGPAAPGPAGFAKGRCPLASAHSRMSNTGFPVRRAFCCFLAGFVVCRRSGRQTCRVGLVMVRGQFRFGHRSPWMAAATMAARLHSSSIASARITASMARSSPIHHSM